MQKLTLVPGQKYRGTFWINEYGEIQVRPEQKGTKPGNLKLVTENDGIKLYESKETFQIKLTFSKSDTIPSIINRFTRANLHLLNYYKPLPK